MVVMTNKNLTRCAMKFLCRHWYNIGIVLAAIEVILLAVFWNKLDVLVCINILSLIAVQLHQFEEYGFPGGAPYMGNKKICDGNMPKIAYRVLFTEQGTPDRYPLNQLSAMITNCIATYGFYLLPIIFPNIIWLGLAPMFFCFIQLLMHGGGGIVLMKKLYNPGLIAVVFGHIPLGIWYICHICSNNLAQPIDWILGGIYTLLFFVLIIGVLTYKVLINKDSKYPFDAKEIARWKE